MEGKEELVEVGLSKLEYGEAKSPAKSSTFRSLRPRSDSASTVNLTVQPKSVASTLEFDFRLIPCERTKFTTSRQLPIAGACV